MPAIDTLRLDTARLDAFTHRLKTLSPDDICRRAKQPKTTGDDLDWWRTAIDVDGRLREARQSPQAAAAAHAARDAVLAAASGSAGIDDQVVAVSRAAASDAAGALVAGCQLTDTAAASFAVSCEPVAPTNPPGPVAEPDTPLDSAGADGPRETAGPRRRR